MKPIADVYEAGTRYFSGYQPLLDSFEYEILYQVDDEDYQGDSRIIFKDGDRYGVLIFGWGSCSGCDAMEACDSIEDVEKLRTELHDTIRWGALEETIQYFKAHDWNGDFSYHAKETKIFIEKGLKLLEARFNYY
jgi:hypothetical protein